MNRQAIKIIVIAFLAALISLSGCNKIVESSTPIAETGTPTPLTTVTRTITPTYTRYPTLVTKPTATITPTTELVLDEEMDAWVKEMFAKVNCDLPCIWGITPGKTSINEASTFLYPQANYMVGDNQFTNSSHSAVIFYYETYQIEKSVIMAVGYLNDPIEEVYLVGIDEYPAYSLGNVLTKYGVPGEIWINVYLENPDQSSSGFSSSLTVYYPDHRTIIEFQDSNSTLSEGYVTSCFSNSSTVRSWSKNFDQEFMELFYERTFNYSNNNYQVLSQAAQMDLLQIHAKALATSGEICIATPLNIWYQFEEVEIEGEGNN